MFEKISNLKIWQKLLVVTSLLALPILLLLYVFVDKQNEQIELGYKEQRGLEYIAALRPVLEHVPQHRDTSVAILYGDETLRDSLDTTRKKIESDMAAVDAVDERLGKELKTSSAWQALRASWRQLQPQATTVLARDSFVRHTAVVQQTLDLIRLVGENSTLTTDQNLDAFYLSDTLIQQASSMTENLSQMRGLGAALAARGRTSPEEAGQMLYYMRLVENANGMVQRNMASIFKINPALQTQLGDVSKNAISAADKFKQTVERELIAKAEAVDIMPRAYSDLGTVAIEDYFVMHDAAVANMKSLLSRRVGDLRDQKYAQLGLGFLILGVMGVMVFSVNVGINRQVQSMLKMFQSIGVGDYQARADVYSKDELGQLANSLNTMLDNTLVLIQSREERDQIQGSIMKLLEEVSGVGDGDLRKEAEVTSDITGAIADSFNYMIGELRGIISSVQNTTKQVDRSARLMQVNAESLAQGSVEQSAQIVEASQTIEKINASIRYVSTTAGTAAGVAEKALTNAKSGSQSVQRTIEGMDAIRVQVQETSKRVKRLGESSQEIGEIVELIGDIADRTSILALNASIQAAAAGEAGRGFAVVAEEVDRLAERAALSTKKISTLIRSVQADTNEAILAMENTTREVVGGSQLANDAGLKLGEIESVSNEISRLVREILEASRSQALSSEDVTRKVIGVTEFTTRTAHGAQEVEGSVRQLAALAKNLNESMSRFKLPADEGQTAAA
jgi:twitching motility protein PilJ